MIITHTQNARGERRIYLGGKGSMEGWLEPVADGCGWRFKLQQSASAHPLPAADTYAWSAHVLTQLADALGVPLAELDAVPFEAIAALHTVDPSIAGRVAGPRRRGNDYGFMATLPTIKPASDALSPTRLGSRPAPRV